MRTLLLLAVSLLVSLTTATQAQSMTGGFMASVDDHAAVFVNGRKVFHGDLGTSRSPEMTIKAGDRIVCHLVNDRGPKRFLLLFASTDGKQIISFRASDYKLVTQVDVKDFDLGQYRQWTKAAKKLPGHKGLDNHVKNYSDWVWGDLDRSILACAITPQMFSARPQ